MDNDVEEFERASASVGLPEAFIGASNSVDEWLPTQVVCSNNLSSLIGFPGASSAPLCLIGCDVGATNLQRGLVAPVFPKAGIATWLHEWDVCSKVIQSIQEPVKSVPVANVH